jgi:hypothetical protein
VELLPLVRHGIFILLDLIVQSSIFILKLLNLHLYMFNRLPEALTLILFEFESGLVWSALV